MKINGRDYIVSPALAVTGKVLLEIRAWGVSVGAELITVREARQLARLLDSVADRIEAPEEGAAL